MKKLLIATLTLVLLSGCGLGLEAPACDPGDTEIQGACLIGASKAEEAYARRILALLGGNYPVNIYLEQNVQDVHDTYIERYAPEQEYELCVVGYSAPGEIRGVPQALAHELTHLDVERRTGLAQSNRVTDNVADAMEQTLLDHETQGWVEEDYLRLRWADAISTPLLPYAINIGCD